jgi:hypothetical protein
MASGADDLINYIETPDGGTALRGLTGGVGLVHVVEVGGGQIVAKFDKAFGLPIPPVDAIAPTAIASGATTFFFVLALLALAYALWDWRKSGRPIILSILIGGGLTVLVEPFVDLMGACWHPVYGQDVAFQFMGRHMPWWIVAVYFAFYGAQGALVYSFLRKGVSARALFLLLLIPMAADVAIEELTLPTGLYIYYGAQPLMLFGNLPYWWVPCNSFGLMIGISLVYKLAPSLRGLKSLALPFLLPMGDLIAYVIIGMPSWIVINTAGVPWWLVQAGGVVSFALAALVFVFLAKLIATDRPRPQSFVLDHE